MRGMVNIMMNELEIRMARLEDAEAILSIYNPYIEQTAITFEYDKVPVEAFQERMKKIQSYYPWLVCEIEGTVVGYAYGSQYKERAAFAWDCECSVYVADKAHGKGIATLLYKKLLNLLTLQGFYTAYALITVPNEKSVALHHKFGFLEVGTFTKTGYKFDTWWDLLIMEKRLNNFDLVPLGTKSIHEII